jgi:GAF domain-containing protein
VDQISSLSPDLTKDERSAQLPGVTGKPYFRFYCGMPLINPEGFSLGSLCVLDFQPREITYLSKAKL